MPVRRVLKRMGKVIYGSDRSGRGGNRLHKEAEAREAASSTRPSRLKSAWQWIKSLEPPSTLFMSLEQVAETGESHRSVLAMFPDAHKNILEQPDSCDT
jgi:hypothetical protein